MVFAPRRTTCLGLLASGGLDSSILLGHLLEQGFCIQPLYVRCGLIWEPEETAALSAFLAAVAGPRLAPLMTLDLPLADVYQEHWSVTGRGVPAAGTPDEAVYLPGRNSLLLIKSALWCQLRGIDQLALGHLGSNPFGDATRDFFENLESALNRGAPGTVRFKRPFAEKTKLEVMELGRRYPLELTFSCLRPRFGLHCGKCNKCAERQDAFELAGRSDSTQYAVVDDRTAPQGLRVS